MEQTVWRMRHDFRCQMQIHGVGKILQSSFVSTRSKRDSWIPLSWIYMCQKSWLEFSSRNGIEKGFSTMLKGMRQIGLRLDLWGAIQHCLVWTCSCHFSIFLPTRVDTWNFTWHQLHERCHCDMELLGCNLMKHEFVRHFQLYKQ